MMYGGFYYADKHSFGDFGLIVRTVDRPLIAPQKTVQDEKASGDGKEDYTAVNQRGRAFFDNKTITVECSFQTDIDYPELQRKTAKISAWLANIRGGFQQLVFDDMPMIAWSVKPTSNIPVSFQYASSGTFNLTFECEPFNSYSFDNQNIPLDCDILLDSDFQLGGVAPLKDGDMPVYYTTSAPCCPVIKVKGRGNSLTVSCNGYTLTYNKAWNGEFVIDCASESGYLNANGVELKGDYFEFFGGDNELEITGITGDATIETIYPFNVFYGED